MIKVYRSSKKLGQFDKETLTLHTTDADLTKLFRDLTSTQVRLEAMPMGGQEFPPEVPEPLPSVDSDVCAETKREVAEETNKAMFDTLTAGLRSQGYKVQWTSKYDKCVSCGGTRKHHLGKGLCADCYNRVASKKFQQHFPNEQGKIRGKLTREYLMEEYVNKKKSLGDIALKVGCTRQAVYKALLKRRILARDKLMARKAAVQAGKLKGNIVNENFFSTWTSKMAYVLGVICTDGNLTVVCNRGPHSKKEYGRLTIAQKEPELLKKILRLMDCDAKLLFAKRHDYGKIVSGERHFFHIMNETIYDDLLKLGLTPNKSLTLKFPQIPHQYVRHFIRGCWDGDGSVYIESRSNLVKSSFTSGSLEFIQGMLAELEKAGFPKRRIYQSKRKNVSYYFRFCGEESQRLFHYLYDLVSPSMYVRRKHELFAQAPRIGKLLPDRLPEELPLRSHSLG